jgi:hypothetical protein
MRHDVSPFRAALVLVGVLAMAGCGRADDQRAVTGVTERLLAAVHERDGERACAQLTDGAVQALEHDEGESCAEAAPKLDVSPRAAIRAQVFATSAKVDLADGASAFLELTPRGWRVAAAGCRPEGSDQPYTCEIEA